MDAFSSLIPIAVVVVGGLSILQGSLAPVSYTHLDVYKRQPVGR